jgi:hypothetical protein
MLNATAKTKKYKKSLKLTSEGGCTNMVTNG